LSKEPKSDPEKQKEILENVHPYLLFYVHCYLLKSVHPYLRKSVHCYLPITRNNKIAVGTTSMTRSMMVGLILFCIILWFCE